MKWHADTCQADARPIAERRLRAQVWRTLLAANLVAFIAGLWFVAAAIF